MNRMVSPPGGHSQAGAAPRRVMVIGSLGWSLVNFRLDLMRRMRANGHHVTAVTPDLDGEIRQRLESLGIRTATVPMQRTGINPLADMATMEALRRLMRRERPDVVIPYTMKPIVYGAMAARLAGVPACYPLFTGLGYAFSDPRPRGKRRIVRDISVALHRLATGRVDLAFCYNDADRDDIRRHRMIPPDARLVGVPGSGVDTARFAPAPLPPGPPVFLFVGRMLRSKGVEDALAAARLLRAQGLPVRLELLGPTDSNPDAIAPELLARWQASGEAVVLGETRDVVPHLHRAHVVVLPTRLREGVPRTILEAMACGRPVITTDAPGCRETVADGRSGLVVPAGDVPALARAMGAFVEDPSLVRRMGAEARRQVCAHHDVDLVNRIILTATGLEAEGDSRALEREAAA